MEETVAACILGLPIEAAVPVTKGIVHNTPQQHATKTAYVLELIHWKDIFNTNQKFIKLLAT